MVSTPPNIGLRYVCCVSVGGGVEVGLAIGGSVACVIGDAAVVGTETVGVLLGMVSPLLDSVFISPVLHETITSDIIVIA